jgi:hypothetical protein
MEHDMHMFHPRWPEDLSGWPLPDFDDFRFKSADDVVSFAELEPASTWRTWPELWHLDRDGKFTCSSKGSSFNSVRTYAERPGYLLECRQTYLGYDCPDRWVMIESRHPIDDAYEVTEGDVAAFVTLRRRMDELGVTLLDVVVFDQDRHWWSLHELTAGTTTWPDPDDVPPPIR